LGARERVILQINAENARHGASMGSASAERALQREALAQARIGEGKATPEQIRAMSAEDRRIYYEQQAQRNPQRADVGGLSPLVAALRPEITAIRAEMNALGPRPPDTVGMFGSANPRAAQWDRDMKALRDQLAPLEAARNSAISGVLSPRVNGPRASGIEAGAGTNTPTEGAIAYNPATGAEMIFRNGTWVPKP
jgi:hypothetical protein